MSSEFDQQNLVDIFVAEASDAVAALNASLYPADGSLPTAEQLQGQYIVAHRIRGAAALYGFTGSAQLTERLEMLLEQATSIPEWEWVRAVGSMREIVQGVKSHVTAIARGEDQDPQIVVQCLAASEGLFKDTGSDPLPTQEARPVTSEYLLPPIDADVLSYFAPEAHEYLDAINGLVRSLRAKPQDDDAIHRLCRTAHTLKGSANTVGFHVLGDIAHPMENCLIAVQEGRVHVSEELLRIAEQAVGAVRMILRRDPANFQRLTQEVPDVIAMFNRLVQGECVVFPVKSALPVDAGGSSSSESRSASPPASGTEAADSALSDDYLIPHLDPEVLSYFAPEAQEYLESLEANLLRLDKDSQNAELINQLFRTAHTLKGSAYTVGFQSVGDLIHHVEDFMGAVRDGRVQVRSGHTDLLLRAVDVVRILMRRDASSLSPTRQRFSLSMAELKQLSGADAAPVPQPTQSVSVEPSGVENPASLGEEPAQPKAAETKPSEEREVIRVSRERLERLLNLVGELVIGRGRLEQRLVVLERLSQQVLAYKAKLVDSVQSFEEKHAFTFPTAPAGSSPEIAAPGFQGLSDFGSLEFDKYDDFNILARRISEVTADITESMSQLSGSIRRAHDDMSQLQQLTLGMRDEIARARMVPVGTPFTRFRRTIREIARASGKEVTLVTSGEHTEVDTGVVERLVDPLIHLVRNAVYHGIELPADRVAKGKPASGTVYLHAAHRGNSIIIEVEDDGAGVDLAKIRAKGIKMGLVRPEQAKAMSDAEAIKLMFAPGFSTAERVGDQAGRGVGLDVVKRVIEGMNGHIDVESVLGVGTKFTLDLPLTLLIATALLVRAGAERYAIPLPSVREVTLPTTASLQQMGDRSILQMGEEAIEVQSLRSILRREPGTVETTMPVVLVRTAAGPIGLAVDELLGRQEIVIKTLGALKPLERSYFGGATIDPEGRVILVVDPGRLMMRKSTTEAAALPASADTPLLTDGTATQESEQGEAGGATILLIDDSLSIRKFVGRMLESAGYQVDTAVDGEDGLRKASAHSYRMIITDLEMPKLNGFEVIQALRSRPQTQATPVVVMTTRAGDKHRQMALSIGASSYIAKPVEERALLQEVERWAGRAAAVRS